MFNYLLVLVFLINLVVLDNLIFFHFFNNHLNFIDYININEFYDHRMPIDKIDCSEYKENVTLIKKIAEGFVKEIWLAKWSSNGYIAVSFLKNQLYLDDFLNNIYMLRNFTKFNSKFTVQYLGNCDNKILFTKFYRLGSLNNLYFLLPHLISSRTIQSRDCFQFCISYAKVIDYLHNSPIGKRVMCDSNDLAKMSSQFLIDDDLNIVANDLDALPDSTNQLIKCGNRSLIGDLIAPEQKTNSFYNHQIDIFKLPFLCNYILSLCPRNDLLDLLVGKLHNRCLNESPSNRPNSDEIVNEYLQINYTLFN